MQKQLEVALEATKSLKDLWNESQALYRPATPTAGGFKVHRPNAVETQINLIEAEKIHPNILDKIESSKLWELNQT